MGDVLEEDIVDDDFIENDDSLGYEENFPDPFKEDKKENPLFARFWKDGTPTTLTFALGAGVAALVVCVTAVIFINGNRQEVEYESQISAEYVPSSVDTEIYDRVNFEQNKDDDKEEGQEENKQEDFSVQGYVPPKSDTVLQPVPPSKVKPINPGQRGNDRQQNSAAEKPNKNPDNKDSDKNMTLNPPVVAAAPQNNNSSVINNKPDKPPVVAMPNKPVPRPGANPSDSKPNVPVPRPNVPAPQPNKPAPDQAAPNKPVPPPVQPNVPAPQPVQPSVQAPDPSVADDNHVPNAPVPSPSVSAPSVEDSGAVNVPGAETRSVVINGKTYNPVAQSGTMQSENLDNQYVWNQGSGHNNTFTFPDAVTTTVSVGDIIEVDGKRYRVSKVEQENLADNGQSINSDSSTKDAVYIYSNSRYIFAEEV